MAEVIEISVVEQRPGWRAVLRHSDGWKSEQTGGTVHAAVTKALDHAGLVCAAHAEAARTSCDAIRDHGF